MSARIDKEKTKKTIALILEKMRTEADPVLLGEYRSLFKKEVSLFNRSWAAAWLVMAFEQGLAGRSDRKWRTAENGGRGTGRNSGGTDEAQRYPLADEVSKRLFISVGRNRRVFPREILGLINSKTAVPREDIGAIRILDNYSFVQVRDTAAERIIEALNGMIFRGRTLTVNYAKTRKEEEPDNGEGNIENTGEENPLQNEGREISEQDQDSSDKENI